MKIDSGLPLQGTGDIERVQKKPVHRNAQPAAAVTTDLSSDVLQLNLLEQQANEVPDIRQERVNALRASVDFGEYQVSDAALADAILRDVLRR